MAYAIPEFVIGATIVAIGTTVPELATAVISQLRGHTEIGLGTILGSNLFNGLFIVGVAAVICPISISRAETAVALTFGFITTLLILPSRRGIIPRWKGPLLLAVYLAFVVGVLRR